MKAAAKGNTAIGAHQRRAQMRIVDGVAQPARSALEQPLGRQRPRSRRGAGFQDSSANTLAALATAKVQNGAATPSAMISRPPSAGPMTRLML